MHAGLCRSETNTSYNGIRRVVCIRAARFAAARGRECAAGGDARIGGEEAQGVQHPYILGRRRSPPRARRSSRQHPGTSLRCSSENINAQDLVMT